jgi:hypothetical protein
MAESSEQAQDKGVAPKATEQGPTVAADPEKKSDLVALKSRRPVVDNRSPMQALEDDIRVAERNGDAALHAQLSGLHLRLTELGHYLRRMQVDQSTKVGLIVSGLKRLF